MGLYLLLSEVFHFFLGSMFLPINYMVLYRRPLDRPRLWRISGLVGIWSTTPSRGPCAQIQISMVGWPRRTVVQVSFVRWGRIPLQAMLHKTGVRNVRMAKRRSILAVKYVPDLQRTTSWPCCTLSWDIRVPPVCRSLTGLTKMMKTTCVHGGVSNATNRIKQLRRFRSHYMVLRKSIRIDRIRGLCNIFGGVVLYAMIQKVGCQRYRPFVNKISFHFEISSIDEKNRPSLEWPMCTCMICIKY